MKANLKIEAIGHDEIRMLCESFASIENTISRRAAYDTFGGHPMSLARWGVEEVTINGEHVQWVYGRTDYVEANSKGSRGVYIYYTLEAGRYYHVRSPQSWRTIDDYYCFVNENGEIEREQE